LLGLGAGLFLLGITQGQVAGFTSFTSWGSFLGAVLAALGFTWRIASVPHPFVSPKLFGNRAYVAAVLVVEVNGLSPAAAGLVLTPGAVAMAILSPLAGRLSDRTGVRIPVLTSLTVMGLSIFFVSAFGVGASPLLVSLGMFGAGVGYALASSPTTNAAVNALPSKEVGVGLGIFQGIYFLGGGAGPAVIGALLAARREAGSEAINPLYTMDAAPFSDVFLAIAVAVMIALLATLRLRWNTEGEEQGDSR
jgi:DHA2 family metal-tetracycline-proton antiporter-like MFS transporter/DHA2 family florfenicol/chloramphenicol resistance protein-like MFS transporter